MGGTLSADGRHRYWLSRDLAPLDVFERRTAVWVMLNPSTADAVEDDPTIRKCIGFTKRWGLTDLVVVNLWSYRATKPADLLRWDWKHDALAVSCNEACVRQWVTRGTAIIVAAWGAHATRARRQGLPWIDVHDLAASAGREVHCLGLTGDGQPRHPLMLGYASPLVPYRP